VITQRTIRHHLTGIIIAVIAAIGFLGAIQVSLEEFQTGTGCPHFGAIPACYIVSLAYALILISVVLKNPLKSVLFYTGWAPVFLLALSGTVLELFGRDTCPKVDGGWPKCYFSLALAVAIILPVLLNWLLSPKKNLSSDRSKRS